MIGTEVWAKHGFVVNVDIHNTGSQGVAWIYDGSDLVGGHRFVIPKRRWRWWERSMERAVFDAIDEAQRRTVAQMEAAQRVEVVAETLNDLREALP